MDVIEAIKTRRSIRQYVSGGQVKEADLLTILEAGRMAPTAGNLQPLYFIAVTDPEQRALIQQASFGQELLGQVPVIIAVCVDPERSSYYGERGMNYFCNLDGANATQNMLLAAHSLGYGACWVGGFEPSKVKDILGLPDKFRVVSLVPVGQPAIDPAPPERRPLEEVIRYNHW